MGRGGAGARQFPECRSLDINPGAIRAQLSCKGEPAAYHADVPLCLISTRESFLSGMALYEARPDKGYSLVDCISMQTMRKEGLTEVLTNDRHFEQEGFRALFR